ncbi:MAG: GGDEF domain-containing protein [Hamadaea sp.]|nr:GGDEF domain-containing protein [Hamadaea sp.]
MILAAIVIGAIANTIHLFRPNTGVLDTTASLLLLLAAVSLVVKRGRNDYSGLIDASLAALALGGLLWVVVLRPRFGLLGTDPVREVTLAVTVLLLSGALGALVRLVETDRRRNRALRLLVVALALNLTGFVLADWGGTPAYDASVMAFMLAYIAVSVVGFDPSMRLLAEPGPPRQERLHPLRLALLGLALTVPAIVNGILVLRGKSVDGAFIVLAGLVMVPLVMLRIGLLAASRDRVEAALLHEASHDPLTGVLNRKAFTERLVEALASARDCTLIFCDLDGFKQVNDQLGHAAGDRLLVEVADRLQQSVRSGDPVGRFGGDEFLALLLDCGESRAAGAVQRVRQALSRPSEVGLDGLVVGVSLGAVVSEAATRQGSGVDDLIRAADEAMYAQKQKSGLPAAEVEPFVRTVADRASRGGSSPVPGS